MSDPLVIAAPLLMHVGFLISVEMVSGSDRHGKSFARTALRTREHWFGLAAALLASLMLAAARLGSLWSAIAVGTLLVADACLLFRAFAAAKATRLSNRT